mgnify:CR=1 FL=1
MNTFRASNAFDRFALACAVCLARSEEHTSELRHVVISYAAFCLKKKSLTARFMFLIFLLNEYSTFVCLTIFA